MDRGSSKASTHPVSRGAEASPDQPDAEQHVAHGAEQQRRDGHGQEDEVEVGDPVGEEERDGRQRVAHQGDPPAPPLRPAPVAGGAGFARPAAHASDGEDREHVELAVGLVDGVGRSPVEERPGHVHGGMGPPGGERVLVVGESVVGAHAGQGVERGEDDAGEGQHDGGEPGPAARGVGHAAKVGARRPRRASACEDRARPPWGGLRTPAGRRTLTLHEALVDGHRPTREPTSRCRPCWRCVGVAEVLLTDVPRVVAATTTVLACALLVGRRRLPATLATAACLVIVLQGWLGVDDEDLVVPLGDRLRGLLRARPARRHRPGCPRPGRWSTRRSTWSRTWTAARRPGRALGRVC